MDLITSNSTYYSSALGHMCGKSPSDLVSLKQLVFCLIPTSLLWYSSGRFLVLVVNNLSRTRFTTQIYFLKLKMLPLNLSQKAEGFLSSADILISLINFSSDSLFVLFLRFQIPFWLIQCSRANCDLYMYRKIRLGFIFPSAQDQVHDLVCVR